MNFWVRLGLGAGRGRGWFGLVSGKSEKEREGGCAGGLDEYI